MFTRVTTGTRPESHPPRDIQLTFISASSSHQRHCVTTKFTARDFRPQFHCHVRMRAVCIID
jgi:hypothetical protein